MGTSVLTQFTLIIPVFNGEPYLTATFQELETFYRGKVSPRIIFVDDGSIDNTGNLLSQFVQTTALSVEAVSIAVNSGKGNAIRHVLNTEDIQTPYVGFTDVEIPYSLKKVDEAVGLLISGDSDIVIADRTQGDGHQQYARSRKLMTQLFRLCVPKAIRSIHDTQSGLKIFRTDAAKNIFMRVATSRWVFDIEIFLIAFHHAYRVYQLPVKIKPSCLERGGVSLLGHSWQILSDIYVIYRNERKGTYHPS